jgi:hypothetical protein
MECSFGASLTAVHFSIGSTKIPAAVSRPITQARCSFKSTYHYSDSSPLAGQSEARY